MGAGADGPIHWSRAMRWDEATEAPEVTEALRLPPV
jgi:hypothetical protein